MFKDKTLLITGGTGSFGNAVLNRFLDTDIKEIRIFSPRKVPVSEDAKLSGEISMPGSSFAGF